jgi:hypothetical protein
MAIVDGIEVVTPADAEEAKRRLQATTNFNIDDFLRKRSERWDRFHTQPIGSTPRCIDGQQLMAIFYRPVIGRLMHPVAAYHLRGCGDCQDAYRSYAEDEFYFLK